MERLIYGRNGAEKLDYTIKRSKRRTVAIHISKDGEVEVRCPKSISDGVIDKLVYSKQKWIDDMVSKVKAKAEKRQLFFISQGSQLRYLGDLYTVQVSVNNKATFDNKYFYLPVSLPQGILKQNVIKLYKELAKQYLFKKVTEYSKVMNVSPSGVKINSAKTRWGSCSGKNSINFSWRLIMANERTIDYVVIHELAHIIEHNHSNRFWNIVKSYMPDYKQQEINLKILHENLNLEDWE